MAKYVQEKPGGLLLRVVVQPRASKTQAAGLLDGALKVRLAAPPVEGAANKALAAFFSKALGVPKSNVSIVSGLSSRRKAIFIEPTQSRPAAALLDAVESLARGKK
ncbi:MAG: YggU family protein [Deltaproteobacteria bacterium]|nr:YggU family protein [Deltaproteobacteria bacterium]